MSGVLPVCLLISMTAQLQNTLHKPQAVISSMKFIAFIALVDTCRFSKGSKSSRANSAPDAAAFAHN